MQIPKDKINAVVKAKNFQYFLVFIAFLCGLAFLFFALTSPRAAHSSSKTERPELLSPVTTDFTEKHNKKSIEKNKDRLDTLEEEIEKLSQEFDRSLKEANRRMDEDLASMKDMKADIAKNKALQNSSTIIPTDTPPKMMSGNAAALGASISNTELSAEMFEFHYDVEQSLNKNLEEMRVTSGTFSKAVLLSGADADASVNAQSNTDPILLRLLDDGIMPNGKHAHLKGCFITASVYGDISSERGEIRTQRLSCINKEGKKLDIPVFGTVVGDSGKDGLRGIPVMRNGEILTWAGLSGFFSGVGQSMQQAQTTQSISPLGTTSTVNSNQTLQAGMYGGAGTALSKLADYYIKRADQYHPIIQINPGSIATVVFLKPFLMDFDQPVQTTNHSDQQSETDSNNTNESSLLNSVNHVPELANNLKNTAANLSGDRL